MSCSAIAAIATAVSVSAGGDMIVLAPHSDALAQVCYQNNEKKISVPGSYELEMGSVRVRITITLGDAEKINVTSVDNTVMVLDGYREVLDGDAAVVMIVRPGF